MAAFLGNLRNVTIASFVLALLLVVLYASLQGFDGPTFELFSGDLGFPLGAGGRYDSLLERFGLDQPATGFVVHADRCHDVVARRADASAPASSPHPSDRGLLAGKVVPERRGALGDDYSIRPGDVAAWFLASRTARRLGRFANAESFLESCQRLGGITDADPHLRRSAAWWSRYRRCCCSPSRSQPTAPSFSSTPGKVATKLPRVT